MSHAFFRHIAISSQPPRRCFRRGRLKQVSAGTDYTVAYGYDSSGRLNGVTGPGLPAGSGAGVEYTFMANSDLIEETRIKTNASTVAGRTTRSLEPQRDLVNCVSNEWNASLISKYAYANDSLGRRTAVVREGSAFSSEHFEAWEYNNRSELTKAGRFLGADPAVTTQPVTGWSYEYAYDPIGNRRTAVGPWPLDWSYTSNGLNQYTSIGSGFLLYNYQPAYDADGNLTQDDTFAYTWDGENRLVSVAPATSPVSGDVKVMFTYDFMGRRVRKVVQPWTGSAWGAGTLDRRFVYDGWNLLLELDGLNNNAVIRKYTWGLDLSGQNGDASASGIHGAGGIGGLLACSDAVSGLNYAYFFDTNGNVGQLINIADGSTAASYEYDPYGGSLASTGIFANSNPFRFSTKYFISESGQYDYGRRFYDPRWGRWTSRDPIEELGGNNPYRFVSNCPPNTVDYAGLFETNCTDWKGQSKWVEYDEMVLTSQEVILPALLPVEILPRAVSSEHFHAAA